MKKQIEALKKLGLTDEEIKQVLDDDKKIERGEKLFELTAEQEKASKQARQGERKPTVYKLDNEKGKRSKKANADKQFLVQSIVDKVNEFADKPAEITNAERELIFFYKDTKYKIVLSAPRT